MRPPELALLGISNSGKTHYAGQLYGRVRRGSGALRLRPNQGTPVDLSALQEVLTCIEEGRAAQHTSASTSAEVFLPLIDPANRPVDLHWPDYGGEQIRSIFDDRVVPSNWYERLRSARGWLLMLRLADETTYSDALTSLTQTSADRSAVQARGATWDAAARTIETLQILLHAVGLSTVQRLRSPRLAVLLSCYDELGVNAEAPGEVLKRDRPLLYSFVTGNWAPDACAIWGLSALGKQLTRDSRDEDFVNDGPECQGWVVPPGGGERDCDLSKPVAWLLGE